jgi:GT2 family glycosyltransferase
MSLSSPISFCISTYNNLSYLRIAVESVRNNSYFKHAPFIIHAENCTDGTNEWLEENQSVFGLTTIIESENTVVKGIGGGMNVCADRVETEYIMFLHSDFYVTKDWDIEALKVLEKYPDTKLWVSSHRVEPNIFNNPQSRPGTLIVPPDLFGAYHNDFNQRMFEDWATDFKQLNPSIEIPKGEGVSGLIRKVDWDYIGGNDPLFAPASYDDMDLFLRMLREGYRFILTSNSLVWHFGARGSHRLEENNGRTSERQSESEQKNLQKWLNKWGKLPVFDQYGMIKLWKEE